MELALKNGFNELTASDMQEIDGGIGLLTAVLVCGGCFVGGGLLVGGICAWLD